MSTDTSMPAFPCLPPLGPDGTAAVGYPYVSGGMTLRDYFAAKAMHGIMCGLSQGIRPIDLPSLASDAYVIADAMLKAREP